MERSPYLIFFMLLTLGGMSLFTLGVNHYSPHPNFRNFGNGLEAGDRYELIWEDIFEGDQLSEDWIHETGDGCPDICGWGNNELQYYQEENTQIKDGVLVITAKAEEAGGKNYTSSRIKTQGRQAFTYGRFDIRAKLPQGQGIWPAIWMLGENITDIGWPACGEIDIMEMTGGTKNGGDNTTHGTLHWKKDGDHKYEGSKTTLAEGAFHDDFHDFSLIWTKEKISWLLDGEVFNEIDITPDHMEAFHKPHFLILNLAVGGNWPGSPDHSTSFPQTLEVEHVRVYREI